MTADVVVVGAGPAGLSAAIALADAGAAVRVVDEQPIPGGQIYRALGSNARDPGFQLDWFGSAYARGLDLLRAAESSASVELSPRTSVWDISRDRSGLGIGLLHDDKTQFCRPRHVLLATGAMERPTPFPGWTLPGVMTVGAAQTLFKESALVPEAGAVIAGTGPLVYLYAHQLCAAGCPPELILDTAPAFVPPALWGQLLRAFGALPDSLFQGRGWLRAIARAGTRRITGVEAIAAHGDGELDAIDYRVRGREHRVATRLLLVHDGVIPNTHLALAAGCAHRWHAPQAYWYPRTDTRGQSSIEGISIVGDCAGIAGGDAASSAGTLTGWRLAQTLGLADAARVRDSTRGLESRLQRIARLRRFLDAFYRPFAPFQLPDDGTVVCRCEQVTAGEIRAVAALGCMGPNQGKAFTRCGMGPCMGRQCGNSVSALLADHHRKPVEAIGHYRIRPPVRPLTVGQLARTDPDRAPRF